MDCYCGRFTHLYSRCRCGFLLALFFLTDWTYYYAHRHRISSFWRDRYKIYQNWQWNAVCKQKNLGKWKIFCRQRTQCAGRTRWGNVFLDDEKCMFMTLSVKNVATPSMNCQQGNLLATALPRSSKRLPAPALPHGEKSHQKLGSRSFAGKETVRKNESSWTSRWGGKNGT